MQSMLLRPFGAMVLSVRNNCPWHRSNWQPVYFPFLIKYKLKHNTPEALMKSRNGRCLLMRRILREKPFLGWNHQCTPREERPQYPVTSLVVTFLQMLAKCGRMSLSDKYFIKIIKNRQQ
uniref:Bm2918, isoform b n=1 Tax=Brugia malayi TaxID=6279 RepID=A0A1I9G656_BRUMA|nr:Bm2918, isoform b [Brugia malayi]